MPGLRLAVQAPGSGVTGFKPGDKAAKELRDFWEGLRGLLEAMR